MMTKRCGSFGWGGNTNKNNP